MRQAKKRTVFSWIAALVIVSMIAGGCVQATPASPATSAPLPTSTAMPAPPTYTPIPQATAAAHATTVVQATGTPPAAATGAHNAGLPRELSTPLLRINKNFEILPADAESWEVSADGLTWTFHLDKNLMWSDGNHVTANDYVLTFQSEADPKHATRTSM
jgi:oligopeptide transport system substrate-binding protein